jgi:uncharacterized protein
MRIIRKSSFTPKPWKNGGGVTHEAVRVPAEAEDFEWRVSVAHIGSSGPFSDFAAYNRKMVLLEGDGVDLRFGDGSRCGLKRIGDLVEFDGALPTHCTLLGGPCVDLNLMVSKACSATASVQHLVRAHETLSAHASSAEVTLIFGIDGAIEVSSGDRADESGGASEAGGADETACEAGWQLLARWDLGLLSDGSARIRLPGSAAASNSSAIFLATITTNQRGPQCLPT